MIMLHRYRDFHPYGLVILAALAALAIAGAIGTTFTPTP